MAQLTHWKRRLKDELVDSSKIGAFFSSPSIDFLCRRHGHVWRDSFWSPALALVTFLLQVLDGAKTLRAAVATLLVHLAARGESDLPSCDPGAYGQARRRVPWPLIADLLGHVARALRRRVSAAAAAQNSPSGDGLGHRVWIVDGSRVSMPDTPELQKAFPQRPAELDRPRCPPRSSRTRRTPTPKTQTQRVQPAPTTTIPLPPLRRPACSLASCHSGQSLISQLAEANARQMLPAGAGSAESPRDTTDHRLWPVSGTPRRRRSS